ncbi:hypothetical protein PsorP6_015570 [Peronosclerospora sorghi]|uniref:Uncharacterized protein n=1 Tax=Peronosclerospora sorghi TaxID=230839 RepID=A0ACC0WRR3_9STRA|nr:hypothetical protein PsorP6_015570 [Peronosclerospora sorghi]
MNTLADGYTVKEMMTLHHHYMSDNSGNQLQNIGDLLIAYMMLMRGEDDEYSSPAMHHGPGKDKPMGQNCSGTAMRSKSPELCAIGAIAFYLFYRFHIDKESFPDFKERKNWYGTYLFFAGSRLKQMNPDDHREAQKMAFKACGIFLSHIVHKPRKVGANIMSVAGRECFIFSKKTRQCLQY